MLQFLSTQCHIRLKKEEALSFYALVLVFVYPEVHDFGPRSAGHQLTDGG